MIRWKTLIVGAVVIATALLTAAAFARSTAVATMVVTQTCPDRVPPRSMAAITAMVRNTGDEDLHEVKVDSDAGTPGNEADDFFLTRTIGDDLLNPGETWTFVGSYRLGDEDNVSVVIAEALSPSGEPVDDLDACPTDIIQPPVPGVRAGVAPVSGKVMIKLPGSNTFVALDGQTEIPMGAQVDTRKGAVRLISGSTGSTQSAATATQSAVFSEGLFTIRQKRARQGRDEPDPRRRQLRRLSRQVARRSRSVRLPRRAGPPSLGQRQGPLLDPGALQRGDGARDALADAGPLRRHAHAGDAGRRQRPGLPLAQDQARQGGPVVSGSGSALVGASNPSAAASPIDQIFTGSCRPRTSNSSTKTMSSTSLVSASFVVSDMKRT